MAAVQRALALNDSLHWSHIVLGWISLYQQQYEQALAEMKRGVALAPTEAGTYAALAEVLSRVGRSEEALEAACLFFQYYRENANYLERTYDFVVRLGIETVRKETVYAPEAERRKMLDRLQRSKSLSKDAWLEREAPVHATQFVQIEPMENVFA